MKLIFFIYIINVFIELICLQKNKELFICSDIHLVQKNIISYELHYIKFI